jgi:hypothetical protein
MIDARGTGKAGWPDWLVMLLLVVLGPLGLIPMWIASRWKLSTRVIWTAGYLFPPVWALLIWELRIALWARLALIALLVAANELLVFILSGAVPTIATLAVTAALGVVWATTAVSTKGTHPSAY